MKHKQHPLRLALLAMLAGPTTILATPVPVGGTTVGSAVVLSQAIARNSSGATTIAWFQSGGAYFEMLDGTGTPITSTIQVASSAYALPAVAMDDDGDAVVSWVSGSYPGRYSTSAATVYAQIYGSDGQPKGAAIDVGPTDMSWGYLGGALSVAMDPNGDFVETWTQSQTTYSFPYSAGYPFLGVHTVYARAFSSTGTAKSNVITVSGAQTGYNECSSVGMNRWGDFTIATTFGDQPAFVYLGAGGHYTVQLQRYSPKGVARGAPIVATQFDNTVLQSQIAMSCASIAMNHAGDFSLVWRDPTDTVYLQRYTPWTTVAPAPINVATTTPAQLIEAPVAVIDNTGQPGVIWGNTPDGLNLSIYGQWFKANGTAMAPPFMLEASLPSYVSFGLLYQATYAAAADAKGDLGLFWRNEGSNLTAELFSGF